MVELRTYLCRCKKIYLPQIPYGIGIAAGIRVGNMLGAGEPGKAKKVSIIAAIFASEYKFLTTQIYVYS